MTQGRKACCEGAPKCEPKSAREALYCQANHSQMTRTEIAEVMGINPNNISRWSDPQGDEHMPEQRLAHLLQLTDDSAVYVTYLASLQGLVVYDPKSAKAGNVARMVSEFGELLQVIDEAGAEINADEAERIEREGSELIAAVRLAIEDANRRSKRGPRAVSNA